MLVIELVVTGDRLDEGAARDLKLLGEPFDGIGLDDRTRFDLLRYISRIDPDQVRR
jgi:hypothetical protein